jgi:hypothetical protein
MDIRGLIKPCPVAVLDIEGMEPLGYATLTF